MEDLSQQDADAKQQREEDREPRLMVSAWSVGFFVG